MGDITMRVRANVSQAQKSFEDLADSSEELRKEFGRFAQNEAKKSLDDFTNKQKRLQIAMTATKGETAALTQSVGNYDREIQRLIRGGLSPTSDAVQRLRTEQQGLTERLESAEKAMSESAASTDAFVSAQRSLQAVLTSTRGETAALTQASGNYQREIERLTQRGIDPNSEAIRRLRGEQEALQKRLDASRKAQERKTKALKAAKTAIKASAVAVAGLATGIIALTRRNANLANDLANSARVVGLTTEAYQELDYAMRMSGIENGEYMLNRLNRSVIDVRNETGQLTKFLENNYAQLLEQLQNVENNEEAFTLLMDAIHRAPNEFAAAELAMAAFGRNGAQMVLVAQNGAEGINALREEARELGVVSHANAEAAMRFNDAMFRLRTSAQNMTQELTSQLLPAMTNVVVRLTNAIQRAGEFRARLQGLTSTVRDFIPHIGGAVVGITTFIGLMKYKGTVKGFTAALKGLITVIKNYNRYKKISTILTTVWTAIKTKGISLLVKGAVACAAAVAAYATLNEIMKNITVSTQDFSVELENLGELESFKFLAEDIADLDVALTSLAWGGAAAVVEAMEEAGEKTKENLRQRLNDIEYSASQEKNIRINTIKSFLVQRAKLESEDWDDQLAFLKEKQKYLLESETLNGDERLAVEYAVQRAIQALYVETAEKAEECADRKRKAAIQAAKDMMRAYSAFFGGFGSLLAEAGRENRAFFMASRGAALAQAAINTALAITKTIAQFGMTPTGIIKASGAAMKGAAQKARIASSMIPSAETGGRFVVPPSRGVDNSIMRVNPGETVEVTPRGMTGNNGIAQYIFKIGEQVVFDIVNRGGKSGDIHVFEPAANL